MTSTRSILRAATVAGLAATALALPSPALAHHYSNDQGISKNCPPGSATQNAVCGALRTLEYRVRSGHTPDALREFVAEEQADAKAYGDRMVAITVGDFGTRVTMATDSFNAAVTAGLVAGVEKSDGFGATTIIGMQGLRLDPTPVTCPLNDTTVPGFPQTVGALRGLVCHYWGQLAKSPGNYEPLIDHLKTAQSLADGIRSPFQTASLDLAHALENARTQLVANEDATRNAFGEASVINGVHAAQCIFGGEWDDPEDPDDDEFKRTTPCPGSDPQ